MTTIQSCAILGKVNNLTGDTRFFGGEGQEMTLDRLTSARQHIGTLTADSLDERTDEADIATTMPADRGRQAHRLDGAREVVG